MSGIMSLYLWRDRQMAKVMCMCRVRDLRCYYIKLNNNLVIENAL